MSARDAIAQRLEIQRRHNPSMGGPDQRDYRNADDVLDGLHAHGFIVLDLPPGTWRVTVHDDGTIEVVPMLEFNWRLRTADELRGNWWVDVPAEHEDGAR